METHICPMCLVEYRPGETDGTACAGCHRSGRKTVFLMTVAEYLRTVDFQVVESYWRGQAKIAEATRASMFRRIDQLRKRQEEMGIMVSKTDYRETPGGILLPSGFH